LHTDSNLEPDEQWFFRKPEYFPWDIMGLDKPSYAPLYCYLSKICANYEKNPIFKSFLSGNPSWFEIKKHCEYTPLEQKSEMILSIYMFCKNVEERDIRKSVNVEVVQFLEGFQEFRNDFAKRLLELWKSGRIKLSEGQLRKKKVYILRDERYGYY
jgi:hypothetical protein